VVVEVLGVFLFHARCPVLLARLVARPVLDELGWISLVNPVAVTFLPVAALLLERALA
jgi:hypothetical protein